MSEDPGKTGPAPTGRSETESQQSGPRNDIQQSVRYPLAARNWAIVIALGVTACAAVLYAFDASLDLPGGGRAETSDPVAQLAALTSAQTFDLPPSDPSQTNLPSVEEMAERLARRLRQNPNDPEGWRMLGWSYFHIERHADAAAAYAKAIELSPANAAYRSARGEALVRAANGMVTVEARKTVDEALRIDAKEPLARYLRGLADEQSGNKAAALSDWTTLLNDVDANEPWVANLKQRIIELSQVLGVDVPSKLSDHPIVANKKLSGSNIEPQRTPMSNGERRDPTPDEVRAAAALPPSEQMAMIHGMVERLARRLEQSPRDAEGWVRLIRSQTVLGEIDAAKQSLDRALRTFSDASEEREQIVVTARELRLLQPLR